jgi:hypothetical protein
MAKSRMKSGVYQSVKPESLKLRPKNLFHKLYLSAQKFKIPYTKKKDTER